jgi:hypothetical protein
MPNGSDCRAVPTNIGTRQADCGLERISKKLSNPLHKLEFLRHFNVWRERASAGTTPISDGGAPLHRYQPPTTPIKVTMADPTNETG